MNSALRWPVWICAGASLILVAAALHWWGAAEIRTDPREVLVLTGVGAAELFLAVRIFAWLGLSYRDDVLERRNVGALVAVCGGLLAVALIYAGSSVGEGPSYSNNAFCMGLGTATLLALWLALELGMKVSRSITEERDLGSGIRMGCFLLATGLVLARALAGDWESETATARDFIKDGWPAVLVCALALVIEPFARPSPRRPCPSWLTFGVVPSAMYLALAAVWLWHLGSW